jgi:hypothetical protein
MMESSLVAVVLWLSPVHADAAPVAQESVSTVSVEAQEAPEQTDPAARHFPYNSAQHFPYN